MAWCRSQAKFGASLILFLSRWLSTKPFFCSMRESVSAAVMVDGALRDKIAVHFCLSTPFPMMLCLAVLDIFAKTP